MFPTHLHPQPPTHSPLTDRAKVILAWLEAWLPAQLDEATQQTFWQARRRIGVAAQGRARILPHGPATSIRMPISGNGDEAHGHTRLEAIVREVIIPEIAGQVTVEQARQVQQKLRGDFAHLWREVEVALRKAQT